MRYQLTDNPHIIRRVDDNMYIPDTAPEWDDYQAWLAAGNVPEPYVDPMNAAAMARSKRDALLTKTDWTQLYDAQVPDNIRATYATYRQALRDVPQQTGFPNTITWPTDPGYSKALGATNPYPKYNAPAIVTLASVAAPTTPPAGTAVVYVENGVPKVKTDSGTVTEIGDR